METHLKSFLQVFVDQLEIFLRPNQVEVAFELCLRDRYRKLSRRIRTGVLVIPGRNHHHQLHSVHSFVLLFLSNLNKMIENNAQILSL